MHCPHVFFSSFITGFIVYCIRNIEKKYLLTDSKPSKQSLSVNETQEVMTPSGLIADYLAKCYSNTVHL